MKKKKAFVVFCFILGLILAAGGTFFPSFLYRIIYSFDEQFFDIRIANVIPGFRMASVVLTAWGIAIYLKKDKE
jgi:hypothetical protein